MPDGTDLPIPAEGVLATQETCTNCDGAGNMGTRGPDGRPDRCHNCWGKPYYRTHSGNVSAFPAVPAVSLAESNRRVEAERQRAIAIVDELIEITDGYTRDVIREARADIALEADR